jgi:hypothetical protein
MISACIASASRPILTRPVRSSRNTASPDLAPSRAERRCWSCGGNSSNPTDSLRRLAGIVHVVVGFGNWSACHRLVSKVNLSLTAVARPMVLVLLGFAGACADTPVGPDPESLAGYYIASARPDLELYIYDERAGTQEPEQFYLAWQAPTYRGYLWGQYYEVAGQLQMSFDGCRVLPGQCMADTPEITGAAWVERPRELSFAAGAFGVLRFVRDD